MKLGVCAGSDEKLRNFSDFRPRTPTNAATRQIQSLALTRRGSSRNMCAQPPKVFFDPELMFQRPTLTASLLDETKVTN